MEYKDFVDEVKEKIKDFLPEEFADATVEINQMVKNNDCVMDGLSIKTEDSPIYPTVYLNPYFEQIQQGIETDLYDVLSQIADACQTRDIDHDMDLSKITDYDSIKDKIVCKLINGETNEKFLQDKPYTQIEDLAAVYQILLNKSAEGTASVTITDSLMGTYGVTAEELHSQALENMEKQPYVFKGISQIVDEIMYGKTSSGQSMGRNEAGKTEPQMTEDIHDTIFVLTSDNMLNGAAEILNDNTRQEIAEKIGDFYVLPSCIHETIIIPKDAGMGLDELEHMVQEVNYTQVAPDERLSDHVYEYDAKEHELFRSDKAGERAKQKEGREEKGHERISVKDKLAEKKKEAIEKNGEKGHQKAEKKKETSL